MKFIQHYSSSKANLYEVIGEGSCPHRLLLECGIRWQKIRQAINNNLKNIDACLLTHEHMDHAKSAENIMENGIDLVTSMGTAKILNLPLSHRLHIIEDDSVYTTPNSFWVYAYKIEHDAAEPLGFMVGEKDKEDLLLFCPDSAYIKQKFSCKFAIIALEVSYDKDILRKRVKKGDIHPEVAKRIVKSHAEVDTTLNYIRSHCDLSRCRQIHLLHCSGANLNKRKVKNLFEEKLFIETVIL